jgi:hypothetical protein
MKKVEGSSCDQKTVQGSSDDRTIPRVIRDGFNEPPAPGSEARQGLRFNPRTTPRVSRVLSQESRVDDGIEGLESRGHTPGEIQSTSLLRSAGGVTVGVGAEATLTARSTRGGGAARLGKKKVG